MKVIFDTNIWIKHLALQSAAGSSVRFYLNRMKATVALPDVIRRETQYNLSKQLLDHLYQIRSSNRALLSALGKMKDVVLPSEQDLFDAANKFTERLGLPVEHVAFSLSVAEDALKKVLEGVPPNGPKNQQFKDSVIWAHCIELLADDDVSLVTEDRGFFESRNHGNRLAAKLRSEIADVEHQFRIYDSLEAFLEEIRADVSISSDVVIDAFRKEFGGIDVRMAAANGYEILNPRLEASYFVTEVPSEMYVTGTILWDCSVGGDIEAVLLINLSGIYDAASECFTKIRREGEILAREDENGNQEVLCKSAIAYGEPGYVGHRTVTHQVRHRLQDTHSGN